MKHIALIVFYLLIVSTSFCQKKKDNTIVMDTSLSFASLRMILFQNGYTVPNADSIFISTEPKQVNGVIMVKLNFARTDSSIILKGQMKGLVEMQVLGSTLKEDFQQIYFTKENVLTYGFPRRWCSAQSQCSTRETPLRGVVTRNSNLEESQNIMLSIR